jgi:uncharacterized membrane protein (DUF2068 family)
MIVSLLVFLVLMGLGFWVIRTLGPALKIPDPILTVLYVVLVVMAVLYLLRTLGLWSGALP